MTLKNALIILESHQKWRLGDEDTPMTVPSELTDAIATILDHIGDINKMVKISDEEISESANEYFKNQDARSFFKLGAQWYRNQIIKKNKSHLK